jgi:hypothetical protein
VIDKCLLLLLKSEKRDKIVKNGKNRLICATQKEIFWLKFSLKLLFSAGKITKKKVFSNSAWKKWCKKLSNRRKKKLPIIVFASQMYIHRKSTSEYVTHFRFSVFMMWHDEWVSCQILWHQVHINNSYYMLIRQKAVCDASNP